MIRFSTLELVVSDIDPYGNGTFQFRKPGPFAYEAGQHGLFVVPGGGAKPFTFASAPAEELLAIATSVASGSRFKRALAGLAPGSTVRLAGPLGRFTVTPQDSPLVFIAQGIGITPFRSMLRDLTGPAGPTGTAPTTLLHVADEHPFRDETEAAAGVACYPRSRDGLGRAVDDAVADTPGATFLVSGAPEFVKATAARLVSGGVARERIRRDRFYGDRSTRPVRIGSTTSRAERPADDRHWTAA